MSIGNYWLGLLIIKTILPLSWVYWLIWAVGKGAFCRVGASTRALHLQTAIYVQVHLFVSYLTIADREPNHHPFWVSGRWRAKCENLWVVLYELHCCLTDHWLRWQSAEKLFRWNQLKSYSDEVSWKVIPMIASSKTIITQPGSLKMLIDIRMTFTQSVRMRMKCIK